jgi:hypothetical protein
MVGGISTALDRDARYRSHPKGERRNSENPQLASAYGYRRWHLGMIRVDIESMPRHAGLRATVPTLAAGPTTRGRGVMNYLCESESQSTSPESARPVACPLRLPIASLPWTHGACWTTFCSSSVLPSSFFRDVFLWQRRTPLLIPDISLVLSAWSLPFIAVRRESVLG